VADFETKLRWLSERGNPVGAEEMIERIEADLAGDPLVVVAKRREGTTMTTQQPPTTKRPSRYRGPATAVAAFVAVAAVAGLFLAFAGDDNQVADTTPTTTAPDVETMTDLEIIEAGVAALYSGDADRAVELFELPAPNDDVWIQSEAPYQAAIGGRLTLDCSEHDSPGVFNCLVPYGNVFTDAIGWVNTPGDTVRVVVEAGAITEFGTVCQPKASASCGPDGIVISIFTGDRLSGFPEHTFIDIGLEEYVNESGYGCVYARSDDPIPHTPPSIECLQVVMNDLDGWAAWAETNLELPYSADR
jgi:hypothetical protein